RALGWRVPSARGEERLKWLTREQFATSRCSNCRRPSRMGNPTRRKRANAGPPEWRTSTCLSQSDLGENAAHLDGIRHVEEVRRCRLHGGMDILELIPGGIAV